MDDREVPGAPYGRADCDSAHGCGRKGLRLDSKECLPRHKTPDRTNWCREAGRWVHEFRRGHAYSGWNGGSV